MYICDMHICGARTCLRPVLDALIPTTIYIIIYISAYITINTYIQIYVNIHTPTIAYANIHMYVCVFYVTSVVGCKIKRLSTRFLNFYIFLVI